MNAPEILALGKVVAFACEDPTTGVFSWHLGRVQKMLRKSGGKRGNDVAFTEPMLYMDAVAANIKVICNWYRRDVKARGYTFTYDDEAHSKEYPLENALGLVALLLPRRNRYDLMDPSQGPRLDSALQLTKPSTKKGSMRTQGEELEAAAAKRAREQYRPEDLGMRPPSGKARAPPTARVRS